MDQRLLEVLEFDKIKQLLATYAASGLGQRLASHLEPSTDPTTIERHLAETTQLRALLAPERALPLAGFHDVFPLLDKAEKPEEILAPEEFVHIGETLRAGRKIKGELDEPAAGTYPHLEALAAKIDPCTELLNAIDKTFNENGRIKNSASSLLADLRRDIQTHRSRIRSKLQTTLRSPGVSPYLQDTTVHEHKGRPTIAVKVQHANRVAGIRRGNSDSGNTAFIEPEAIRSMGDALKEAIDAEHEECTRLLTQLTAAIAAQPKELRQTLEVLAHLDLTCAKVRFGRAYQMEPANLNQEGILRLPNARHPLLLALEEEEEVVPIDFSLGEDFNTLIVTGPNTGGKTITLKTAGLLCLMTQAGLHIPTDAGATLPVFNFIAADIGDEQSIEQSLSTFSSHLRHIAHILERADEHSLVLLDELGGGTDPAEGAALARAILLHLHQHQVRTVASTHLSPLKNLGYTVEGIENASIEFNVETLRPTHRLLMGTPGGSNALAIAKRMGLTASVLAAAADASVDDGSDTATLIEELQQAKAAAAKNRRRSAQKLAEAERLEQDYRQKLDAMATQKTERQAHLGRQAFDALLELKNQLDRLGQSSGSRRALLGELGQISNQIETILKDFPQEKEQRRALSQLGPGDKVLVRSLAREGVLVQIQGNQRNAVVRLGELPMTVSLDDLDPLA